MDEPIISREKIRTKAANAFIAGRGRNDHGMNPWAPALPDWLAEYDLLYSQHTNHAPAADGRVDLAQHS